MPESLRSLLTKKSSTYRVTAARERKITLAVLLHLNEIERRQLFQTRLRTLFRYSKS
jgi:hypothetical protein